MSEELKPCPWCQRQPRHIECLTPADFDNGWLVGCVDHYEAFAPTLDAAITSWNSRTHDVEALVRERDWHKERADTNYEEHHKVRNALSEAEQRANGLEKLYDNWRLHVANVENERDALRQRLGEIAATHPAFAIPADEKVSAEADAVLAETWAKLKTKGVRRREALTREPSEEEITRIALAIREVAGYMISWDTLPGETRIFYRKMSRAAIAAFIAGRKERGA